MMRDPNVVYVAKHLSFTVSESEVAGTWKITAETKAYRGLPVGEVQGVAEVAVNHITAVSTVVAKWLKMTKETGHTVSVDSRYHRLPR